MKLRKRRKRNYGFMILLIIISTVIILTFIGAKITPRVEKIIEANVNKSVSDYVYNVFNNDVFVDDDLMEIINLNMNSRSEVVSIDYNFNIAYDKLKKVINRLYGEINNLKPRLAYYDEDEELFFIPVGLINHNMLTENLGFKIPCKVNLISNIEMNFKTRVSDYGINSLLVEFYLIINIENNLISPSANYNFSKNYEMILASKVVLGEIPNYYGGVIEKSSAIVSS